VMERLAKAARARIRFICFTHLILTNSKNCPAIKDSDLNSVCVMMR
jgi:hypothetical protein